MSHYWVEGATEIQDAINRLTWAVNSVGVTFEQFKQILERWAKPIQALIVEVYVASGASERDAILSATQEGIITKRTAYRLMQQWKQRYE